MNSGKYKVGKISDYTKAKGWFFGRFADEALLNSNLVEVAWQNISGKTPSPQDKHFHTASVEINIVISGTVKLVINNKNVTVRKGEFYIIWPETIIENVEAEKDTEVIVVRTPSIDDKKRL